MTPLFQRSEASSSGRRSRDAAADVLRRLATARRPCILPGTGVRIAGLAERFLEIAERLGVPVATAFNAHDVMANDNPLFVGRPGTVGDRAGNFAVQNADFLLVLGCRLNIRQISYNWASFARAAVQGHGRRRRRRAGQADAADRPADPCRSGRLLRCARGRGGRQGLARGRRARRVSCLVPRRAWPATPPCARTMGAADGGESLLLRRRPVRGARGGRRGGHRRRHRMRRHLPGARVSSRASGCSPIRGRASMGYDLPAAIGAWYAAIAMPAASSASPATAAS